MLDERCKTRCTVPVQVTAVTSTPHTTIAASPRVQQMRSERMPAGVVTTSEIAGYRPTGSDGITASPKVRQMLDERRQVIEIAPLK
jgi:hypothetical protein